MAIENVLYASDKDKRGLLVISFFKWISEPGDFEGCFNIPKIRCTYYTGWAKSHCAPYLQMIKLPHSYYYCYNKWPMWLLTCMVTFFPLSHPSLSNALQHFLEYKHVQILTGVNMKIVLCLEAQVFLVEQVLPDADQYTDKVQQNFAGNYPNTAFTHHSAVWWLNAKFHETGSQLCMCQCLAGQQ